MTTKLQTHLSRRSLWRSRITYTSAQKYSGLQNKPNYCRFWAKNSYLEEKQTQNKPNQTQFLALFANFSFITLIHLNQVIEKSYKGFLKKYCLTKCPNTPLIHHPRPPFLGQFCLMSEQLFFHSFPACCAESPCPPIAVNHSVAGDYQRQGVPCQRRPDSPDCFWSSCHFS